MAAAVGPPSVEVLTANDRAVMRQLVHAVATLVNHDRDRMGAAMAPHGPLKNWPDGDLPRLYETLQEVLKRAQS